MASKKMAVPPYEQAVITKCELCDRGEARYFCEECQEDMCKQCKSIHLRSKLGRNHMIISTAEEVEEEKPVFCPSHAQEEVQMYCNDCNVPVCLACIADKKHPNHALVKIADAVDRCRKELSKCVSDKKQEISELEAKLKTVSNNKKEYEAQHNEIIDGINHRRVELKAQVDKAADDRIKEAKKHKNQDIKELEKCGDDITRIISDARAKIESCEEMLQTKRGFPVIQLSAELTQKLEPDPLRNLLIPVIKAPRFVCDTIDIQGVFGRLDSGSKGNEQATGLSEIHGGQSKQTSGSKDQPKGTSTTIDTTTVAEINPGITSCCVSTVNDKEAWVAVGENTDGDMALVDINGKVKKRKTMDFYIWNIAVTSDGDLLMTHHSGGRIKKYTMDGQCKVVLNASPCYTYGICITSQNDILVGMYDSSVGDRVERVTTNGQVKQTIKQDNCNKGLFTRAYIITENINGDVCVVDNYRTVVVVNKEGIFRFRYPDTSQSSNTIRKCYGIACDGYGFILISDFGNNQIHQLDRDGRFVRYILTQQHGVQQPRGLSIDTTGKLWICNENGKKVRVVKYRS